MNKDPIFELLFETIAQTEPTTFADQDLCRAYFEPQSYHKNTLLEPQDRKPQYLYFVGSGFMRLFYNNEEGNEVTTHLATPRNFVASYLSFIHEKPATENLATVTDCEVLRIARPNLAAIIDQSDTFKKFSIIIFEHAIAAGQARADNLATLSAEARYRKLLADQPEILRNVPVQYIASYLGIKPQSLSRIRRQID